MLSANMGSMVDQAADEINPAEEPGVQIETAPNVGDATVGLAEGVSLMICPAVNWAETDPSLVAATSFDDGVGALPASDPSSGVLVGQELQMCTGYPASRFILSESSDSADLVVPETAELPPDAWQTVIVDPVVIIDPVVVDPVVADPIEVRTTFVSSDSGWAAYFYRVGAEGGLESVSVSASYDDPTIAAFVSDHGNDPGVEVYDAGSSWFIIGFPIEMAPPVPDKVEFWGRSESDGAVDALMLDAPAMDEGGQLSPESQYDAWAFSTYPASEGGDGADGVANSMSFASFDGQAFQRGFTPQDTAPAGPGFATGTSNSRPMAALAAAAAWMNLSDGDTGSMHLPGGKRRSR